MIILCADDYALTEGVSRAVGELAAARRLSATSVLATTRHWPATAPRLAVHRSRLCIGLHLNLTLGGPLGRMPRLAAGGTFPRRNAFMAQALLGLLDPGEIGGEIERQLDAFEKGLGFPPDHIDGHEHVHVLSGVRRPLLDVASRRYPRMPPLIRDPSDRWQAIAARGTPRLKALGVAALALGFAPAAHGLGLPTNAGFSGFSAFDVQEPYASELARALTEPGPRHIVMCHPGHVDGELGAIDPVVERRRMEYDALMRDTTLPDRIWRPARSADGPPVDWSQVPGPTPDPAQGQAQGPP
jgi:chitin disaccharide deacetylase